MNSQTLDKMRQLRLWGMYHAFKTSIETDKNNQLTADEMLSMLVISEWDDRQNRSIERNIRNARFRYNATVEQIEFTPERGLDKNLVHRLSDGSFIKKKENMFIIGSTGTGKSYLASALGYQACHLGFRVLYANTTKLMASLKMAKADGSLVKELLRIEKQDLLILDDFGIQPFDQAGRSTLMDIIEDRHGKRSTIITSQVPVNKWHDTIGEQTVADAILDRIVHQAIRIELAGDSLRKKGKKATETD